MTALDEALDRANDDPRHADAYYDLLLRTRLWVPTGEDGAPREAAHEGRTFVPVFDTEARLAAWREGPFEVLPAHALLARTAGRGLWWAVNPGTPWEKALSLDEQRWLGAHLSAGRPRARPLPEGARVLLGPAPKAPGALEDAVREVLSRHPEVAAGRLGMVHVVEEGESPHYVIVVDPDPPFAPAAREALRTELYVAVRPFLEGAEIIELPLDEGPFVEELRACVEPLWVRPQPLVSIGKKAR